MYCDREGDCSRCASGYRLQFDRCVLCDDDDECTYPDDDDDMLPDRPPTAAASDLAASTAIAFGLVCVVGMVAGSA